MPRLLQKRLREFSHTLDVLLQNLSGTGRTRKQIISMSLDCLLVLFSLWLAFTLRMESVAVPLSEGLHLFFLLPPITIIIFGGLGIYRWVVRSSNPLLTRQLIKAAAGSALALLVLQYLLPLQTSNPRSLFAIYGLIFVSVTLISRWAWQALINPMQRGPKGEPTAIYGAGRNGFDLVNVMALSDECNPVLFLDSDPFLRGSTVAGLPVFDPNSPELINTLASHEVQRIVLADPALGRVDYHQLRKTLGDHAIKIQTIAPMSEIVSGRAKPEDTREISIDDLLGRNEIPPDNALLGASVVRKSILITGGGGSIGSEMCRQVLMLEPFRLVILEQSEENLYEITEELETYLAQRPCTASTIQFVPVLGSVLNNRKLKELIKTYSIESIFHAAAYKHVPIIESAVEEGFYTNVMGTLNVLDTAIQAGVERFVLISTDKAVRPTNVMGATKRLAEMVLQAKADLASTTNISMVRFGNVLGSSGSVVPKFKKQIDTGGPVSVTDAEVTRYFMSIPEASQLVLQAASMGVGGEVFVLDMGTPIKIIDLARDMITLSGKKLKTADRPDGDIEIVLTGLRPGEKLHEELFLADRVAPTSVKKIQVAREPYMSWAELEPMLDDLHALAATGRGDELAKALFRLIEDESSNEQGTVQINRTKKLDVATV